MSASDLVRRFNACRAVASGDTPSVVAEVYLLQEVALTMVSDFPAAPTATETSAVVALAAMADARVVSAVLNTLATRVADAVSVSADSVLALAQAARLAVDACRRSAAYNRRDDTSTAQLIAGVMKHGVAHTSSKSARPRRGQRCGGGVRGRRRGWRCRVHGGH